MIEGTLEGTTEGTGAKSSLDLWQNRVGKMKCLSCMYFVLKNLSIGRCRRNAPTMKGYPVVFTSDWCGEHKLDENKILKARKE